MVGFSFITTRFLGADDAYEVFATPAEHIAIDIGGHPSQRYEANVPVVFPIVDSLENLIGKDFGQQ